MSAEAGSDAAFAHELVKLLLQAAWADGEVAVEETEALHDFAVRSGVTGGELEALDGCLAGLSPLPVPNLGLLKPRRTEALSAVQKLLRADKRMHEDEEALLAELASLLG
jgi:uncharacterized tellurite resistance protein B-like protein